MGKRPGEKGRILKNGWQASRAPHISVNPDRLRRYDIHRKKLKRTGMRLFLTGAAILPLIFIVFSLHWIGTGIALAVLACLMILASFCVYSDVVPAQYSNGYLAPGLVVSSNPTKILTLVPIQYSGATIWGCNMIRPGKGDWNIYSGEKIPCSVNFSSPDKNARIYSMFLSVPLIWATDNRQQLRSCIEAINAEEWRLLQDLAPCADKLDDDIPYGLVVQKEGFHRFKFIKLSPWKLIYYVERLNILI